MMKEGTITVTLLSGEHCKFAFDPKATVENLQNQIATSLHVPARHQKLLNNNMDVKVLSQSSVSCQLFLFAHYLYCPLFLSSCITIFLFSFITIFLPLQLSSFLCYYLPVLLS
jgi:Ubiquitin family